MRCTRRHPPDFLCIYSMLCSAGVAGELGRWAAGRQPHLLLIAEQSKHMIAKIVLLVLACLIVVTPVYAGEPSLYAFKKNADR